MTLLLLMLFNHAFAINVGFNQAWFKTHYSGQYLDQYYDVLEVERILKLEKLTFDKNEKLDNLYREQRNVRETYEKQINELQKKCSRLS